MSRFRTPQRRQTRQRSGFGVGGDKTGSTCKIETTRLLHPHAGLIKIHSRLERAVVSELFSKRIGVVGAGLYVRPEGDSECIATLSWEVEGNAFTKTIEVGRLQAGMWQRVGLIDEIAVPAKQVFVNNLSFEVSIKTKHPLSAYGVMIGALNHEYFVEHDVHDAFRTKTALYIPEILYLDPTEDAQELNVEVGTDDGAGHPIVCKSCNRCSRFLPIDIENERNTLGYSNHCASRAPCSHSAFSTYRVKGTDDEPVQSHYGHQLECKPCKKFFVNLPLNPLRDSTQHREDSLRRRALEVLVTELLGKEWIYHAHRMATSREFDVDIWEKFGRKCFKCNRELATPNEMDLDHTLPLAYLWPLDTTATCLCPTCNSSKSDKFPVEFYTSNELERLSQKTGISLDTLKSKPINRDAVERLFARIDWFFDNFLSLPDYQKVREGKKAADLIVNALHNVLRASGYKEDLVELYSKRTGRLPNTVSLKP